MLTWLNKQWQMQQFFLSEVESDLAHQLLYLQF